MATSMTNKDKGVHLRGALCAMASSILRIKSCLYQVPANIAYEYDDVDGDDEWGIVHPPTLQRIDYQSDCVRLEATFHEVRVSLAIVVARFPHIPPHLRLQQTRVLWTFNTTISYSPINLCFTQAPMFDVQFLTLSHFNAYVSDRLEFAAYRYSIRVRGSRPSHIPSLIPEAMNTSDVPTSSCHKRPTESKRSTISMTLESTAQLMTQQPHKIAKSNEKPRHVVQMSKKVTRLNVAWMQSINVDPRYMDYEQSAAYRSKRVENQMRRRALQSSRRVLHIPHTVFK